MTVKPLHRLMTVFYCMWSSILVNSYKSWQWNGKTWWTKLSWKISFHSVTREKLSRDIIVSYWLQAAGCMMMTTSWSNTCREGRSVLNVSLAPSGTSRLSGEPFWSSTSLGSVAVPSENPLPQTFVSLGLQLLQERFCLLPRAWREE